MIYVYAFVYKPTSPLKLPDGIAGKIEIVSSTYISALVEPDLIWEELEENEERLMQAVLSHDRAICELFAQTTALLPLRFGTCFVSRESLLEHLNSHSKEYVQKLAYLNGRAEYIVKCIPLEMPPVNLLPPLGQKSGEPPVVQGREYFLAKKRLYQLQLEHQRQQKTEWQNLLEAIGQWYPDIRLGEPKGKEERIYILVLRHQESLLMQSLQDWRVHYSCWDLSLGNALPPYHFA